MAPFSDKEKELTCEIWRTIGRRYAPSSSLSIDVEPVPGSGRVRFSYGDSHVEISLAVLQEVLKSCPFWAPMRVN